MLTVNGAVYPVVSADGGVLVTTHFMNDAHAERTLSRAATGDTTEHESVSAKVDEVIAGSGSSATILRVTTGHYAGGDYYDSLVVRRRDLRPVREHLAYLQRNSHKRFDYDGRIVHQTNMSADSAIAFDRRYDMPVYAFSSVRTTPTLRVLIVTLRDKRAASSRRARSITKRSFAWQNAAPS
jgi:hypothetical protein